MTFTTVKKALAFFLPFLSDIYYLNFYGGEPLLCLDLIEQTISYLDKENTVFDKRAQYSITTNGSLLTENISRFLDKNNFSVIFSFDGLAQNIQRKDGSFEEAVLNIKKILRYPNIQLEVNSVFTAETACVISESMALIMDLGVNRINLSLSLLKPWEQDSLERLKFELTRLRKILLAHYRVSHEIPIVSFQEDLSEEIFYCAGGQDRIAVTSEQQVWGCDLFADYFRGKEELPEYYDYYFGNLDTFAKAYKKVYPKISFNYAKLSTDNFRTPNKQCLFCSNLENCFVCPIVVALSGTQISRIPSFTCEIKKIMIEQKQTFLEEISATS